MGWFDLVLGVLDRFMRSERSVQRFRKNQILRGAGSPPFVHLPRPESGQLFLIYPGMDANLQAGSLYRYLGIFPFLQATGLGRRNVTWIRDPFLENYERGFSAEVPDLDSLTAWHRQHLAQLPHVREVYTIGYSSGAYGALLFGHLLGVNKVWAFSPRTSLADAAGDLAARRTLRDRLQVHNGVTQHEVWYDLQNKVDREVSELLAECPGVTARPHPGYGGTHFLLNQMLHHGEFQKLLPDDPGAAVTTAAATGG